MSGNRPTKHAHSLVHDTAAGMAHELYDACMQNNDWYAWWKKQNPGLSAKGLEDRFVAKNVGPLLAPARATLAGMLAVPGDESLKETIYSALILDATLLRGRTH